MKDWEWARLGRYAGRGVMRSRVRTDSNGWKCQAVGGKPVVLGQTDPLGSCQECQYVI